MSETKSFNVKLEKNESNHYILNFYNKDLYSCVGQRIIKKRKLFKGVNLWELCYKLHDKNNHKEWDIITKDIRYSISQPDIMLQNELFKFEK